jgi:hypothetical protein
MSFDLLKKTPIFTRLDILPIPFTFALLFSHYGNDVFNSEHIMAVSCFMLLISIHFLIFFLNFWSVNAKIFMGFRRLDNTQIDAASHVKVILENKKQHTVRRYIVPLL